MNSSFLFARGVKVCRNGFENDNVVFFDDVDDVTLDISEAFFYQWRFYYFTFYGSELEFDKFVCIGAGACSYTNDFIKYVNRGD